jgi:hypothetical protein
MSSGVGSLPGKAAAGDPVDELYGILKPAEL